MPHYLQLNSQTETPEWLNDLLYNVFPTLSNITSSFMKSYVEPLLNNDFMKPSAIEKISIKRFALGSQAPRFLTARTFQMTQKDMEAPDHVCLDFNISYQSSKNDNNPNPNHS